MMSQICFDVFRRAGKNIDGQFLHYTCCTHIVQSICNISEIANRKTIKILGTLRKTRQQRQPERHQTKGLMSKTMVVHVHYNPWYISLLSSAKKQHEMTKFCIVLGRK